MTDRLRYRKRVRLGRTLSILFACYNTAWTSQREEQQGNLLFPNRLLVAEKVEEEDHLRVSLLHHRDNWLEANNARHLREYVETYSDIIFTGHEHVGAAYTKATIDGMEAQYVRAPSFKIRETPATAGS